MTQNKYLGKMKKLSVLWADIQTQKADGCYIVYVCIP